MEEATYNVVSKGTVLEGQDPGTVKRALSARFGLSSETADRILSGRRVVLKKGLPESRARSFVTALRRIGVDAVLTRPRPAASPSSAPPPPAGVSEEPAVRAGSPEPPPPDTEHVPLSFRGAGWEYFKIWLVNAILSVVTLGVYSAWAKVRRKRYLYASTRLEGASFAYLADPVKILKGRALVVGAFILYSVLEQLIPFLAWVLGFGFLAALPWIVVQSLAFNARNSAYRSIRFGFRGSVMDAAKAYLLWPILVPFTLGLLFPYVYYRQKAFVVENHRYGTTNFSFDAVPGDYYRLFLGALIPLGIGLAGTIGLAFLFAPLSVLGFAVLYLYLFAFFSVRTTNLLFNAARIDEHRFSADLEIKGYGWIVLTNTLATAFTLGLFHPWAVIRTLRYKVEHLTLLAAGPLDRFIAAEEKQIGAVGEEAGEFLDLDLGL